MNKQAWIKRGLCLMVALCMLVFGGMALSEGGGDEAAAPQFTVTNPTVAIGEFFEVDVSAVEGAAAYRALLIDESIVVQEDPDEQVVWSARAQSAGKIYLTTAQAHTGTFTMKVAAYSDKATANEISRSDGVTVTITDNDQLDEGVLFRVAHREDLKVGDFLYASIYAPGSVDTFISAADSEMHWNTVVRELNCAGTIHVSATAVFADGRVVDREADVQVASEGAAGTIHLGDVTTRVHAGEDIVGSYGFSLTQGVQARNVVELYDPLRGGDVYYSEEDEPGDIHIPGRGDDGDSLLEAGRAYTLYVGLEPTTRGYEKVYETIQVVVDGETDDEHQVTLTVAGQTDSVGVPNHQEVLIVISAPDASAVRLFRGGELERLDRDECHYWNDEDGIEARLSWSPWQTGTLYAEACYGDPDDGNAQWVMSNVVLLRVDTGNGTLPVPDVSMPRTVNRGDMLTIEIDRGESPAQWYWADMNRDDEEYTHVFHADTDTNEFHIPTAQLAPGVYDVTVGAGAEGFEDNTVSRFVTINGDEADPTQAVWNFSAESAQTMESFAFSVYVPQAQSIHADMFFTDGWEVHEDEEGDLFYRNDYSFPVGGTFTVTAVAAFGDGHTEEFTRTFEITSDGALDSIELTAPATLLLGNDLVFSFTEAAEAENYHVRICPADEGWNAVYETDMDQAGTVTLSTGDDPDIGLEDGRRYVISVMATARNRDAASAEAELFSYRQAQSEHTVTLTVNGSSEAAQVMAQEDMAVVVEAEGADYVRWFDGYNWREDMRLRAGSDRQYVAWPNTTDSFTMYARAWYSTSDEDGYFVYSSPVNVTVETPGEVGGYTLTVPDTVEWGSPLTVTLGKAEHAREYHVRIENIDGGEYFFFCPQPGTLYLPTRMLEPDNEYRVTVNARGGVGYSWRFEERRFTVTGEKTASPAMTLSAASILPQEDLLATGSVPGAAKLRLYVDGGRMTWEYDDREDEDTWYTWSDDVGSDTFCFESGSHTFAVSGLVNGEWTEPVSAAVTVTAGGALAAADVVMNGTVLMEGQGLEISVAPVENAQDYHIYIHREGTDGDDTVMSLSGLIPNKTYTFSGSLFEAGFTYRVDVNTNAPGYVSGYRNARFTVMPNVEPAEGATLTAHVDEGTTLPIYGNFRVTVDVADENATAYMVYDGDGGWDVDVNLPDDEGRYEYRPYDNPWFSFGENGTYTLFAKYTTDTFEPWQEGWEDTVTWHYTNSANVTVTTEDELPAPRISVPATVQRGQLLEIEIANAADYLGRDNLSVRADPYHAGEDRRYGDNYEWNDNGVIYMPTAELEAGRVYTLYVHASAVNCRMVTTQTQFTVTEPDEPLDRVVWAVNEQEISTMAPVTMAIYAENAHQIDLEVFDSNGSRCGEWHEGRGELYISSWMSDVAGEYRFVARVYFDGEDEPQTEERTVTVVAENGPLTGLALSMDPHACRVGQDLVFTLTPAADAEGSDMWITEADNGQRVYEMSLNGRSGQIIIPASDIALQAGRRYRIEANAYGRGYDSAYACTQFYAYDGELGSQVTLTIESNELTVLDPSIGSTGSSDGDGLTLPAWSDYTLTISAPGADMIEFSDSENWRWERNDWYSWGVENGMISETRTHNEEDCLAIARAHFPGENGGYWAYSNPIMIRTSAEDLAQPTFNMAYDGVRGSALCVTIAPVSQAEYYEINVWATDEGHEFHNTYDNLVPGKQYDLPTWQMEAGSYAVGVNVRGKGYWTAESQEVPFTVVDNGLEGGVRVWASDTEVVTGQRYMVNAYAPGAQEVRIYDHETDNLEEHLGGCGETWTVTGHDRDRAEDVTYYARACYDGNWSEPSESVTVHVTSDGELAPVTAQLSGAVLSEGEELVVSLGQVPGATRYDMNLRHVDYWGAEDVFSRTGSAPFTAVIPADYFQSGEMYRVDVNVHAMGKDGNGTGYTVLVRSAQEPSMSLTVNGQTDEVSVLSGENIIIHAAAPAEATMVQVFTGYEWESQDGNVYDSDHVRFDDGRTVAIWARYTTAQDPYGENVTWDGVSDPVLVTSICYGELYTPEIRFEGDAVRGLLFPVTVTNGGDLLSQTEDVTVEGWLERESLGHLSEVKWDENGVIQVVTADVAAGSATLVVRAMAPGWRESRFETDVQVQESDLGPVVLTVTRNTVLTGERVHISVYAPGATSVRLYRNPDDNDPCDEWGESDSGVSCWEMSHPEEMNLTAEAWYYNEETDEWTSSERCEPVRLSVVAPEGRLGDIVGQITPGLISQGDSPVLTIDEVENAEHVWWDLHDTMSGEHIYGADYHGPVNLYANWFVAGRAYNVNMHASARGYDGVDSEAYLVVRPAQIDEGITLSVTPVEGDTILVGQNYRVHAVAPETAKAVYVTNGRDWDWAEGNEYDNDTWNYRDVGTYTFIAMYTEDDIDPDSSWWNEAQWAGVSEPVVAEIQSRGVIPVPEVMLSQTEIPRGDLMGVLVLNAEELREIEGLRLCGEIFQVNGEGYGQHDSDDGEHIYLPTSMLETDENTGTGSYVLRIRAEASGYVGNEREYDFTVIEPQEDDIRVSIHTNTLITREKFFVSIYAPGANFVRLLINGDRWDEWGSSFGEWEGEFNEAGEYMMRVAAHYYDENTDTEQWRFTNEERIVVSAQGDMSREELGVRVPTEIGADQDLTVSWNDGAAYDHYDIEVHRISDDYRVWHSWGNSGSAALVPAVMPDETEDAEHFDDVHDVFEAGEAYRVHIHFDRRNYNSLDLEYTVLVEAEHDGDVTLTVNGQTDPVTVPAHTDVQVAVNAPENATGVAVFDGWNWQWMGRDEEGLFRMSMSWGDDAVKSIYAKYTAYDFEEGQEPWNEWEFWNNGEYGWSGISNIVIVTSVFEGYTDEPMISMGDTFEANTDVTFTVSNGAEIGGYNWIISDMADGWEWNWEDWQGRDTQTFSTEGFVPGHVYRLKVNAYGAGGLRGRETYVPFTVTAQGKVMEAQLTVPNTVARGQMLAVTVHNGEALLSQGYEGLYLHAEANYYNEDEDRSDWYGRYNWDGHGAILVPTAELEAGREYELHIRVGAHNWLQRETEHPFTVTEPEQGVVLTVDKTQVQTGERFILSAYAPGANAIQILENGSWMDEDERDSYVGSHDRSDAGEYTFVAAGGYYDEEEDEMAWVNSDPITVTVTSEGDVTEAELGLTIGLPALAGEDLTVSWNGEMASRYDIWVVRPDLNDDNGRKVWHTWGGDASSVTVPHVMPEYTDENTDRFFDTGDTVLIPGEIYEVEVNLDVPGYDSFHARRQFMIQTEDGPVEDLVLTVDGKASHVEWPVNTNVPVHVDAPEGATAVLAWGGYDWQWYNVEQNEYGSWTADWEWSWGDESVKTLYVQYTTDPIDGEPWNDPDSWNGYGWLGLSNSVTVTVTSEGSVPAADVDLADSYPVNGDYTFTVKNADALGGFQWRLTDASGMMGWETEWTDWNDMATQTFSTRYMSSNTEYKLVIGSYGVPAYTGNETGFIFTVTEEGDMIPAQAGASETVARGDYLTVTIRNVEALRAYDGMGIEADVSGGEEFEEYFGTYPWDGQSAILVPTAELDEGVYEISVWTWAQGYGRTGTDLTFEVTAPQQDQPIFRLSDTEVLTGERYGFSVYAPGATAMLILENGEIIERTEGDIYVVKDWWRGNSQEIHYKALLCYEEDFENEANWHDDFTNEAVLRVTAPNGPLPAPSVTLSKQGILQEGETFTLTIGPSQDAEEYSYWLEREGDGWVDGHGQATPFTATMPVDELWPDRNYFLHVDVSGRGYEAWHGWYSYYVKPASQGEQAQLTVNGGTADIQVPVNQGIDLVLTAPDYATGVAVRNADGNWEFEAGNRFERLDDWGRGDVMTAAYIGRYTTDPIDPNSEWWENDVNWVGYSNAVAVTYWANAFLPEPEMDAPASVARGDMLTVRITNLQDFDMTKVFGIHANVYRRRDDRWYFDWMRLEGGDTYQIPTAGLEAGETYQFHVNADGMSGVASSGRMIEFTVTQPEDGGIHIAAPESVPLGKEFKVSVYAPGAKSTMLYIDGELVDGVESADEDYLVSFNRFFWEERELTLYAKALYEDGEGNETWITSDNVTVAIVRTGDSVPQPVIDMPIRVQPGRDVTVNVLGLEGFDGDVYLNVQDIQDDWRDVYDDSHAGEGSFVIPAGKLEAGRGYRVNVDVSKIGCGAAWAYVSVVVVAEEGIDPDFRLTINGSEESASVTVHEAFHIRIEAPEEANVVRLYNMFGPWRSYEGNVVEDDMDWYGVDTFGVYARWAHVENLPQSDEEWDEIAWSDETSNVVTIHVTSEGALPVPEFEMPGQVTRGEDLVIHITNLTDYEEYDTVYFDAIVAHEDGEEFTQWYGWDGQGEIRVPTIDLPEGETYRIHLDASGVQGREDARAEGSFTVTEATGPVIRASKTTVQTHEGFEISAYCPGAVHVELSQDDTGYFDETGDEPTDHIVSTATVEDAGEYTYTAAFRMADGTEKTASVTITVTATQDEPLEVTIHAPAVVKAGSTLVTVDVPEAENWYVRVSPANDRDTELLMVEDEIQVDLSGCSLISGEMYVIECGAFATGRNAGYAIASFLAAGDADEISLTVSSHKIETLEEAFAVFYAPGASSVEITFGGETEETTGDQATRRIIQTHAGTYDITAIAHYDDKADETRTIQIEITAPKGRLQLEIVGAPETLEPGQDLTYSVNPYNADYWWTSVTNLDTNKEIIREEMATDITVPADQLIPGQYKIVAASCMPGWDAADAEVTFTVANPVAVALEIAKTDLLVNEEVEVTITASDAVTVGVTDEEGTEYDFTIVTLEDGVAAGKLTIAEPGEYDLYAFAVYADDTRKESETVHVTVTSLGQAAVPEFTLPGAICQGEKLPVTLLTTEHAAAFGVSVSGAEMDNLAVGTHVIDTSALVPGQYEVTVTAHGEAGYTDRQAAKTFIVVPAEPTTMTLPTALKTIDESAFEGIPAQRVILSDGVTAIGSRAFANCANLAFVVIPASVTSIADDAFEGSPYVTFITTNPTAAQYAASHGITVR